jgi:transposase|tara:strand:- start:315 stop:809 length:495 start_codon:yes stop_codon:yes gene_type:complete
MHVEPHHDLDELRRLDKSESQARRRLRLRTVILARQHKTAPQIVEALGLSRRTVQRIIERYNHQGLAVLDDRPGRGRKSRVSATAAARLRERLDAGPTESDGVCTFTGPAIAAILEREFGVLYSVNGVYELLHRLGYSWLTPRPRHEDADPQIQEAFKKTSAGV